jgi:hypothetical protein
MEDKGPRKAKTFWMKNMVRACPAKYEDLLLKAIIIIGFGLGKRMDKTYS